MVKFEIKIQDKKVSCFLPEQWEEVTLEQIINLNEARSKESQSDPLLQFSALTNLPLNEVNNTSEDLWNPFFRYLNFMLSIEPDWLKLKHPDHVILNGKRLDVPKDLGLERFGQKVLVMELMKKNDNRIKILPDVLAVYFQPLFDEGNFDRERVETIKRYCMKLKALHAVPIANFFLNKLEGLNLFGLLGFNPFQIAMISNFQKLQKRNDFINLVNYN